MGGGTRFQPYWCEWLPNNGGFCGRLVGFILRWSIGFKWVSTNLILEDEVEVSTVLTEGPILPAFEPQNPAHRFPVFNKRNTLGSSSTLTSPLAS